jgi:Tfp pilus assembly protein FimV
MNDPTMTARIDLTTKRKPGRPAWAAYCLLLAAAAMALPAAQAAETSAAAASALKVLGAPLNSDNSATASMVNTAMGNAVMANTPVGNFITVQKGESIDAVLRRGLPGMPLKDEFMRQALAKANPKVFPRGQTYQVRPGTVLALPSVEALRQHILAQSPQAAGLFQASAVKEDSENSNPGPDKRRWVRFP